MDNIFPKFRFFPAQGAPEVEYTGPVTADAHDALPEEGGEDLLRA